MVKLFIGILPIIILSFLNYRVVVTVRATTRRHNSMARVKRRDTAMVALLTGVVVVLVICHTPKTIINLYECYHILHYGKVAVEPLWSKIVIKLSHFLLTLSSALNIIIYSAKASSPTLDSKFVRSNVSRGWDWGNASPHWTQDY